MDLHYWNPPCFNIYIQVIILISLSDKPTLFQYSIWVIILKSLSGKPTLFQYIYESLYLYPCPTNPCTLFQHSIRVVILISLSDKPTLFQYIRVIILISLSDKPSLFQNIRVIIRKSLTRQTHSVSVYTSHYTKIPDQTNPRCFSIYETLYSSPWPDKLQNEGLKNS